MVRDQVAGTLPRLRAELGDAVHAVRLLRQVGEVTERFAYGDEWFPLAGPLGDLREELRPAARLLTSSAATNWWWASAGPSSQRWIGDLGEAPPMEGSATEALQAGLREQEQYGDGAWWSTVISSGVTRTTRALEGVSAVALACREDAESLAGRKALWAVDISPAARIFEVRSAADWGALTARYPRLVRGARDWSRWTGVRPARWAVPDWLNVKQDWDGVHVTTGGYLSAAYQPISAADEVTILAGWNPDETLWLSSLAMTSSFITEFDTE